MKLSSVNCTSTLSILRISLLNINLDWFFFFFVEKSLLKHLLPNKNATKCIVSSEELYYSLSTFFID